MEKLREEMSERSKKTSKKAKREDDNEKMYTGVIVDPGSQIPQVKFGCPSAAFTLRDHQQLRSASLSWSYKTIHPQTSQKTSYFRLI